MTNILNQVQRALQEYVDTMCEGKSTKAAENLGVNHQTFWQWLKGKRIPSLSKISPVLDLLGYTLSTNNSSEQGNEQGISDLFERIDVFAAAAGGTPIDVYETEPLCSVYVPKDFVKKCDYAVECDGDSMSPTIPDKSICGVKLEPFDKGNEIYLAYIPLEGMTIKRVRADRLNGLYIFHSDNPLYPEFSVSMTAAEKIVIGKIVWTLRRDI
ncbi:MAG: hypothetical protein IJU76_04535 [Desulfovibrionaceae bacterium]|nr:hypothetical protein [Desulfovibrionaceae bacterium]